MMGGHDNTAPSSSEERLERVLDTEAVGLLFFDYSGTLIDANDAFLRMTVRSLKACGQETST